MEKDNRRNRGIFIRLTKKFAIKEIKKQEQKLGRKLTKEEKHKIAKSVAKIANVRTRLMIIAGVIGISGAVIINGLPEGGDKGTQESGQKIFGEQITEKQKNDFREGIKVLSQEEIIEKEIEELDSSKEVERYMKDAYIEAYEQMTGDENINTSQIEIDDSYQNYVYVLDDGRIVTHGDYPYETEAKLKADGLNYDIDYDIRIYTVNGATKDAMTSDGKQVILGNNYEGMKNENSVLANSKVGNVIKEAHQYKELLERIENGSDSEIVKNECVIVKSRLTDAALEYSEEKMATQTAQNNQQVQHRNKTEGR